jgi:MFS family permease
MQQVVLGWLVFDLTDSSAMVGVVFALRAAPNLVVGFVAGAIADRFDRRTLMRLATFGMALMSLLVAWSLSVKQLAVWHVFVYAGVLGTLFSFEMTARQAYVYDVVGNRSAIQGMAMNSLAQRVGGALGALLAGATLQGWGASVSFLLMGLCYGTSVCVLYALQQQGAVAPLVREPLWQNVRSYVQALRTNRLMRSLIVSTAAAELLGFSHQVMLPVLAKDVLHVGAAGLGVLTTLRFVGGMLGVAMLTLLGHAHSHGMLLMIALALFGVGEMLLGQATHFWLAGLSVAFINVMASATDILHHTLLQQSVSNEQRGRAMGSWVVGTGTAPVGHLEIGYLAGMASASMVLMLHGMALLTLPLILTLCFPQLRRL